jgi:hypothetical protein
LRKGYRVLADLPGWEQPDTVKGVRPDLSVKKKGHETLIEVETPESEESKRKFDLLVFNPRIQNLLKVFP